MNIAGLNRTVVCLDRLVRRGGRSVGTREPPLARRVAEPVRAAPAWSWAPSRCSPGAITAFRLGAFRPTRLRRPGRWRDHRLRVHPFPIDQSVRSLRMKSSRLQTMRSQSRHETPAEQPVPAAPAERRPLRSTAEDVPA